MLFTMNKIVYPDEERDFTAISDLPPKPLEIVEHKVDLKNDIEAGQLIQEIKVDAKLKNGPELFRVNFRHI